MTIIALATSVCDLKNDDDMPLLVAECEALGVPVEVCAWDDPAVDWSRYAHVILRSTWNYIECRDEFLIWAEGVAARTNLVNPLSVVRWASDKHYLGDLAARGVPVVPSRFIEPGEDAREALRDFLATNSRSDEFVVKPTVGSYSKNVKRFVRAATDEALEHVHRIFGQGRSVILQPYLSSVDRLGETNLTYFDRVYSHAIRKSALLMSDGTVNGPTADFRAARVADADEQAVALAILDATVEHLGLERPLLYGRVDLIRGNDGTPMLLELDICEPSLSFPFCGGGAARFARTLGKLLNSDHGGA